MTTTDGREMPRPAPSAKSGRPVEELEVLVTAAEAFPVLERAFLDAESEIVAGFRVFDPLTPLVSDEARRIGKDWFDLIVHTLNRGVTIHFTISDFDPVGAPDMHRHSWSTHRQMVAAAELADAGRLITRIQLHDARLGLAPRLLFFPMARKRLGDLVRRLNDMDLPRRLRFLEDAVRLRPLTRRIEDKIGVRNVMLDLFPASHHQKLAVFDRRRLYIGGLDLDARRYDTKRHKRAAERTWYDVQLMVEGPVVDAAHRHLRHFHDVVACRARPDPAVPGFLRTLSCQRPRNLLRMTPRPLVCEIEQAHLNHVAQSSRLIYMETQFLRHLPLARALARRARDCPSLKLIVLLPAAPETAAFSSDPRSDTRFGEYLQLRCLRLLRRAFGDDRLLVVAPVQPRRGEQDDARATLEDAPLIYVHAKVSVFDDRAAIVSSANLNGRSMRWDTEAGLELTAPDQVRTVQQRVMQHWDGTDSARLCDMSLEEVFAAWKERVDANTRSAPEDRKGFLVHYDSDPARAEALPLPGVPEELV